MKYVFITPVDDDVVVFFIVIVFCYSCFLFQDTEMRRAKCLDFEPELLPKSHRSDVCGNDER